MLLKRWIGLVKIDRVGPALRYYIEATLGARNEGQITVCRLLVRAIPGLSRCSRRFAGTIEIVQFQ